MRPVTHAAALAAALSLAGCPFPFDLWGDDECAGVQCYVCPPGAVIEVTDAVSGAAVAGVSVTGGTAQGGGSPQWTCSVQAGGTYCSAVPLELAPFDALVQAPGYGPATVRLTPTTQASGNCCPACTVFLPVTARLTAAL